MDEGVVPTTGVVNKIGPFDDLDHSPELSTEFLQGCETRLTGFGSEDCLQIFGVPSRDFSTARPRPMIAPMDAETFEAGLEHHLPPTLEGATSVVRDNLNVHKSPRVAEILTKKNGTVRYLRPYSPDFNPIEKAYSKLKSLLRNALSAPTPACRHPRKLRRSLQTPRTPKLF